MFEKFIRVRQGNESWSFQRWLFGGRCGCSRDSEGKKELARRREQWERKPGDWMPARELELDGRVWRADSEIPPNPTPLGGILPLSNFETSV